MCPDTTQPQDPAATSPTTDGTISGSTTRVPVKTPTNVNKDGSVNVIGLLNPQFGNVNVNE